MRLSVLVLFVLLNNYCLSCFSQSNVIKIQGKIIDRESLRPVPYASIVIRDSNFGTASDSSGNFVIAFESIRHPNATIRISSIGFTSQSFSVDSMLRRTNEGIVTFPVRPEVISLELVEISEKGINGKDIIKKAIAEIANNAYAKPFTLEYYSKIKISDSLKTFYTVENVFQDFNEGGYHTDFYLQQRSEGTSPLAKSKCGLPAHFDILQMDILTSPYRNGILDAKNLPQFDVKYQGIIRYEGDSVYVIEYKAPKPNKQITATSAVPRNYFYSGKLYIDVASLAIVRHSLQQGISKQPLSQEILYRKVDGYYLPYYIESSRLVEADKKKLVKLTNMLMLRDAQLNTKRPAPSFDNCNPPKFDSKFWSSF